MNESIKKFREEAQKLEESDALKEARKKYVCKIDFLADFKLFWLNFEFYRKILSPKLEKHLKFLEKNLET